MHYLFYLICGIYYGRMISAAEFLTDRGTAKVSYLTYNVHGNLSCGRNLCISVLGTDFLGRNAENMAYLVNYLFYGYRNRLMLGHNLSYYVLCHHKGGGAVGKGCNSVHFNDSALNLTDIVLKLVRHIFHNIIWYLKI